MLATTAELLVYLRKQDSVTTADRALIEMLRLQCESAIAHHINMEIDLRRHTEVLPAADSSIASTGNNEYPLSDLQSDGNRVVFTRGAAGSDQLTLKHTPVHLTGIKVYEDYSAYAGQAVDSFAAETLLALGTDYFLDVDEGTAAAAASDQRKIGNRSEPLTYSSEDAGVDTGSTPGVSRSGVLYRIGAWPTEPRSIRVSYWAGWSPHHLGGIEAADAKLAMLVTWSSEYHAAKSQQAKSDGGVSPITSEGIGKYNKSIDLSRRYGAGNAAGIAIPAKAANLLQPHRNYGKIYG